MSFWEIINDMVIKNAASNIGSLGEVAFEVTGPKNIFTLNNFNRTITAKIAEHEVIGGKSVLEFTGPGLQTISFDIKIHSQWGHDPKTEMDKLIEYCEGGAVLTLILGDGPIGDNKWMIEKLTEQVHFFTKNGNILYSEASLELREYVENEVKSDDN